MDRFYELVTGDENAFYKMCIKLPLVVDSFGLENKESILKKIYEYVGNKRRFADNETDFVFFRKN